MLLSLALALLPQAGPTLHDIQARIPKTPWVASLTLAGWKEDGAANPLRAELGDKLLLAGTLEPHGTILSLIVEPNTELISPQAWRKRLAPPGVEFDVQLWACVDASIAPPGAPALSDFHGYLCAAGYCFDLHVSRVSPDGQPALTRAQFEDLAKSLRVLLLRRGWAEHYPEDLGYQMTLAALAGPGRKGWKQGWLPKHAEEWTAQFVEAEFLRFEKAPPEQQIACYQKALELVAKLEKPGPRERFAWAMICDGLGLALYDAKLHADAIAPLSKGYALLVELGRKERGALAYNLACAQALSGHAPEAIDALRRAIEADERYREGAAKDADLDSLKKEPGFQKLLAKPAR